MQPSEYCLLWQTWLPCLTRTDWAAWVQAIGSVLALGVAIGVVVWQARTTRHSEARAEGRRLQARAFLFEMLAEAAQHLVNEHMTGQPRRQDVLVRKLADLRAASDALAAIALGSAHSELEVVTIVHAQRSAEDIARAVDGIEALPLSPENLEALKKPISLLNGHAGVVRAIAKKLKHDRTE